MLSYTELERAARVIASRFGGWRLQAALQPDPTSLVLTFYGHGEPGVGGRRRHLLLCCRPGAARAGELEDAPPALPAPPALAQYLRAHGLGRRLAEARLLDQDRQLLLRLAAPGPAPAAAPLDLVLSLLGPRSNLYLLEDGVRLVASARPLAETRPELELGGLWRSPASRPPTRGGDRFGPVPDAELLRAIEAHYASDEQALGRGSAAQRVARALRRQRKQLERKLEKLRLELALAGQDAALERQGELLKGALSRVKRGDREVEVDDPASGERVRIALDPTLSPGENLERIFQRYRKGLRGLTRGGAQEDVVRAELEAVRAEEEALARAAPEELEAFAARPQVQAALRRFGAGAPGAAAAPGEGPAPAKRPRSGSDEVELGGRRLPARLAPRRFRSADGLEIWVGRSDAANDFLTTVLARGNDLFFHLDGAPGSHVILRTEGRPDPPSESVLDACELAIHYSKAKRAGRADVHVVPIKNVKKPRGAKPGLVTVHGGKTVHLRRSEARLERLLRSKLGD